MNINIIIISVLISLICVLLALIQYYYLHTKKIIVTRNHDPYFQELILTTPPNYYIQYEGTNKAKPERQPMVKEAEQCIKAAVTYQLSGKLEKALKLFEHAAILAPKNPDILIQYGKFLEEYNEDVITADELYFKALSSQPTHTEAIINKQRTSHLVDQLDQMMFNLIDDKRNLLKKKMHNTVDAEMKKNTFYLHIYHTVGIEGNTMTISQLKYLLETGRAVGGRSIVEHNEILGLEIALQYIKYLSSRHFISLSDILEIHKRVMGHVDPVSAGSFRDQQVFVGSHIPPPPERIEDLMNAYVDWLNSDEVTNMHPVRFAALAHYKLVDIHPFSDGNGRTSRLIMNLILLNLGYPPVIIYKEDRQKYYDYLNIANTGDVGPFVRFIAYCTDETLNTYLGLNSRLYGASRTLESSSPIIEIEGLKEV